MEESIKLHSNNNKEDPQKEIISLDILTNGLYSPRNSPGQNTGVGSLSLPQGIFPTQRSNSGFPHCRWILYQLSHKGSPRILEWVAYPFSSRSSRPRNWTMVSCIAGRFFINWVIREALISYYKIFNIVPVLHSRSLIVYLLYIE